MSCHIVPVLKLGTLLVSREHIPALRIHAVIAICSAPPTWTVVDPLWASSNFLESVDVVHIALLTWIATFSDFVIEVAMSGFARRTATCNRTIPGWLAPVIFAVKATDHVVVSLLHG